MMDRRPIILTAKMADQDFAYADRLRRQYYPIERNNVPAHITLFRHLPGRYAPELIGLLRDVTQQLRAPKAMLADILKMSGGVALRIESEELLAIREVIAEHFHGLLTQQDQGHPRLHITIQNKVKTEIAKECYTALSSEFQPRPLIITGLQSHRYDDGGWEDMPAMPFRGKYSPFD